MTKKMVIAYFVAVGLVALLLKSCHGPQEIDIAELPATTDLHVAVQNRVVTVKAHSGTISGYVPDRGRADITVDDKGVVDLRVKSAGLTLQPVIGGFISVRPHIALGVQVAYWNRLEAYVGGAYPLCAWAGIGYRLDALFLSNTSVYFTYTTQKEPGLGLLLQF